MGTYGFTIEASEFDKDSYYSAWFIANQKLFDGYLNKRNIIFNREIHGICLNSLPKVWEANPNNVPELIRQIVTDISERYPEAVLPVGVEFNDIVSMTIDSLGRYKTSYSSNAIPYFTPFWGTIKRFGDKIGIIYNKYKSIENIFNGINGLDTAKNNFFNLVIVDKKEQKTYDVTEDKNYSGESTFNSTTKNADTPENIPNENEDEVISNFISQLSQFNSGNENSHDSVDKKTGTITTDTTREHDYFEMIDELKSEYFELLDEIVSSIAITFDL